MKNLLCICTIWLTLSVGMNAQTIESCVSAEEMKLYTLLMDYRAKNGLDKIPLSVSLTLVARTHVYDLQENQPAGGNCNMHSWSNKGSWSACCYTPDHKQAQCMWNKPKELTSYTGMGYEIACGGSGTMDAATALPCWQGSTAHNNVILNLDIWAKHPWKAVGIGIYGSYAVVWFGEEADEAGAPPVCQ